MYKKNLFQYGAKSFLPYKKSIQSYGGNGMGTCGSGANANLDNYLLSLVKGVKTMSIPKTTRKKRGGALKFSR